MADILNHIVIAGRLVKNPDIYRFDSGHKNVTFPIAVPKGNGTDTPVETSFFDVIGWDAVAEQIAASYRKGDRIVISGELREHLRRQVDQNTGKERTHRRVVIKAQRIFPNEIAYYESSGEVR